MPANLNAPADLLTLDVVAETERLVHAMRESMVTRLRRKGVVVAVSGGIDSSVVAAICVRAFGKDRVFALLLPEDESSDLSTRLGLQVVESLGIRSAVENIGPTLRAAGCYARRDRTIAQLVPGYGVGWKSKIVLPHLLEEGRYALFSLVVQSPDGQTQRIRLPLDSYLEIVAATNFKQRVRKMMEYYYADRMNYAVAGTPNRLEYDLGFFVKNGDGAADLKPIAHLYKTQVYQLASYLGVPEDVQLRPPTTDTYSLAQSQEEFFFSMPLATMDICLFGKDHAISPEDLAAMSDLTADQVRRAYATIDSKRIYSEYLKLAPIVYHPSGAD